jgi:serine/threonine protein kinase
VSLFDIQSWFLLHLARRQVTDRDSRLPAAVLALANRCLDKIMADNMAAVDSYRSMIRNYVGRLRAEQDKLIMGSISTNLLDLLAWLGHQNIAMRDLKPDNLLVAGDPEKYPHFLRTASEYSLGIIDVETAVDYEISHRRNIKQPLLGGTPFYATPSHFIRNAALSETYGDLGNILHLQDWYAVMVMIYRVITGGLLFEQTAKQFAGIKNKIVISNRRTGSELAAIETVSRQFWRSAGLEFQKKLRAQEKTLKTVLVAISPYASRLLISYLKKDIRAIDRSIRNMVDSHPLLSSTANREVILNADHGKICALAADLAGKTRPASGAGDHQARMLTVFNQLANQKLLLARKRQLSARLAKDQPRLSAYELMIVMFNTVLKAMYKEQWQSFKPAPAEPVCRTEDEVSLATTI